MDLNLYILTRLSKINIPKHTGICTTQMSADSIEFGNNLVDYEEELEEEEEEEGYEQEG
jgi:hypothetical protein